MNIGNPFRGRWDKNDNQKPLSLERLDPLAFPQRLFSFSSIRRKVSFYFVLLSFFLLITLTVLTNKMSSDMVIKKTIDYSIQDINLVSDKLDSVFDDMISFTKIAMTNSDIQNILRRTIRDNTPLLYSDQINVQKVLLSLIEPRTNIEAIIIYAPNGNIYLPPNIIMKAPFSKGVLTKIAATVSDTTNAYWFNTRTAYYLKDHRDQNIISLMRLIYSGTSGAELGLIETTINENFLSSLYANLKLGKTGTVFIVDQNGTIIAHKNKEMLYQKINTWPYFHWLTQNSGQGKVFTIHNLKYLVINKKYPRTHWNIVGVVPLREITADSSRLTFNVFLIGFLCILLAVFLTELLSISITRPIIELKEVMRSAGKGDLERRAEPSSSDEIGILAVEFNHLMDQIALLMAEIYEEHHKKREYELSLLQSQINPHFLYNALGNISGLIEAGEKETVHDLVNNIAGFYRGVLSRGSNLIRIRDEIQITTSYLKILNIRYSGKIKFSFHLDEQVLESHITKLTLQPLIENSVYHGLKQKKGDWQIIIAGFIENGAVVLTVADNGVGIEPDRLANILDCEPVNNNSSSFGLKSTNERIRLHFGLQYGLGIESVAGQGTTVRITLPA